MPFNQELCDERHDSIDQKLDRIIRILEGNGSVGLITRLDRVEQRWRSISILMIPVWVGIVGIILKMIASHVAE